MTPRAASPSRELLRRGFWLEYFTISWNVFEAVIAIGFGLAADSIALVGFGFDSTIESVRDLVGRSEPQESLPGIVLALLLLIAMPALAVAKRRTGRALGSATLVADEIMLRSLLSLIILVGLLLNALVD